MEYPAPSREQVSNAKHASLCSIALSKEHAVIEVIDEDVHLVYDLGSRNKTRIGKMVLQPHVRYQLPDGARLQLADVTAVYQRLPVNLEVDDGSNSETGSESMLSLINMVDKEESSQFNVLDAVIVPETPGPSCTKPKNVVIIQESPNSDMDSSFGMTNTCKTNVSRRDESAGVSVTEDKDFKNHSKVKQDTNDDSVFEAETQCDTDCPDMTKCSANTLHMSSVSHNDEVCASESDQEEDDLFEAETQCEEPSLKVLLKSSNANDSKDRNLALRSETVDAVDDDIYEAETQCVPGDIPNEKIGVNVASKGKLGSKIVNSLEERKVNIGTADRLCKTDRFVPNDMGDSPDEHGGEIYDAPTQYISGNGERTSFMGKTDTFSVCSEQTKECMSSHEGTDIKLSVDRKEDITDSSTLTEKKGVGSENKVDEAPSSNREDQQKEQTDSDGNSKVAKAALDASFNEDSFDHSMLEGDVDLFTYEGTCVIDSKEATLEVSNTTKTFSEVHSEGSKSESVSTNSNDTHANLVMLSKECTTKPSKSEKTVSGCGTFEKCTSSNSKLVQIQNDAGGKASVLDAKEQSVVPLMKSLRPTNKETPKLSNGSGDETDPDDIFEVKAEADVSLNRNKKGSTKSFHRSSVESSSDTVTTISKIKSKLSAQPGKDSGDETDPEDIFEARTQIHVPPVKNSKIVSKHSEPSSSKISRETSVSVNSSTQVNIDSGNAEDQDRICETQNQVVESQDEKNRKITNPEDSSKQDSSNHTVPPEIMTVIMMKMITFMKPRPKLQKLQTEVAKA
ncbi:dentin sialophosphoprotein-like [Zootermopsis nevadensis]|uniref:dentin sialophosphoprotein-like n=1 Tax=Zootermopsis nevadensis TaxID=136037 RepID=UPI000B8EB319|nr:dentin sialophosphoprotein-like [Zootermopsis nevadensis]